MRAKRVAYLIEKPPLLYDLTSLQREANNRYGFSAKRTLAAAQRCYEEHKALTYPRTNSRYLPGDMIAEIKPIAGLVGAQPQYRAAAEYVTGLDLLPLARVVNDAKVTDHHAIIPTRAEHPVDKMGADDKRIFDMVARRFLAVFHPEAVFENTRVETTIAARGEREGESYTFRTRGKLMLEGRNLIDGIGSSGPLRGDWVTRYLGSTGLILSPITGRADSTVSWNMNAGTPSTPSLPASWQSVSTDSSMQSPAKTNALTFRRSVSRAAWRRTFMIWV